MAVKICVKVHDICPQLLKTLALFNSPDKSGSVNLDQGLMSFSADANYYQLEEQLRQDKLFIEYKATDVGEAQSVPIVSTYEVDSRGAVG